MVTRLRDELVPWDSQPQEVVGPNPDVLWVQNSVYEGNLPVGSVVPTPTAAGVGAKTATSLTDYLAANRRLSPATEAHTFAFIADFPSLTVGGVIYESCGDASATYSGTWATFTSAGVLTGDYGSNGVAAANYRRRALSPAGTIVAGETALFVIVCRSATDWSIYKNGVSLSLTYNGTGAGYFAGIGAGRFGGNVTGPGNGGKNLVASWMVDRALTAQEVPRTFAEFWRLGFAPRTVQVPVSDPVITRTLQRLRQELLPWDAQPQEVVQLNLEYELATHNWTFLQIPKVLSMGSSGAVPTLVGTAAYRPGKAGHCLDIAVAGDYESLPSSMGLGVSSGVLLVEVTTTTQQHTFFCTSIGGGGNGFSVTSGGSGLVELAKHNVATIVSATNSLAIGLNAIAWSYNNSTGRARIAVNGRVTSATSVQSFSHAGVGRGRYRAGDTVNSFPHKQFFFAQSPLEILSDDLMADVTRRPESVWQLFAPRTNQIPVYASAGVGTIYYVIGPDAGWVNPTAAEVMAGQLAGGAPATSSGSEVSPSVTAAPFTFSADATGLSASTAYRVAYVWSDE